MQWIQSRIDSLHSDLVTVRSEATTEKEVEANVQFGVMTLKLIGSITSKIIELEQQLVDFERVEAMQVHNEILQELSTMLNSGVKK